MPSQNPKAFRKERATLRRIFYELDWLRKGLVQMDRQQAADCVRSATGDLKLAVAMLDREEKT